eukprot:scaffold53021_cov38-Prasinocladus_malaysianus.AAC.1
MTTVVVLATLLSTTTMKMTKTQGKKTTIAAMSAMLPRAINSVLARIVVEAPAIIQWISSLTHCSDNGGDGNVSMTAIILTTTFALVVLVVRLKQEVENDINGNIGNESLRNVFTFSWDLRQQEWGQCMAHLVVEALLVVLLGGEVVVEGLQLVQDLLERGLLLGQGAHDNRQLLLRPGQLDLLGLDDLDDPVVGLHGPHPAAQAIGGLRHAQDLVWHEVWVLGVVAYLGDDGGRDVVLVVVLEDLQEVRLHEHLLGGLPVVVDHLAAVGRRVEHRHGLREVGVALVLHRLDLGSLLAGDRLLLADDLLHLVGLDRLRRDDLHGRLGLLRRLLELRLKRDQLLLHAGDALLCHGQLLEADLIALLHRHHVVLSLPEQAEVRVEQLEVRRGRDVVVSTGLAEEPVAQLADGLVEVHARLGQLVDNRGVDARQVGEEVGCDALECVVRPTCEPVDGRAVDERRELS